MLQRPQFSQGPAGETAGGLVQHLRKGILLEGCFWGDECKRKASDPGSCWNEEGEKERRWWRRRRRRSGVFKVKEAG